MTSKLSLFSLMKEDLRHRKWMLIFSLVAEFIMGPLFIFFNMNNEGLAFVSNAADTRSLVNSVENVIISYRVSMLMIAVVSGIVGGIFGFRHLYNKRMADLYHSAPVSRSRQFLAIALNGFLIWFVSFLLFFVVTLLLIAGTVASLRISAPVFLPMFGIFGLMILSFLSVYALSLFATMFSGNAFASLVGCGVFGIGVFAIYELCIYLLEYCKETYLSSSISMGGIIWLSPLASPIYLHAVLGDADVAKTYYITLILTVLVTLLLFAGSFLAYKKRKAELAEGGVGNEWVKTVIRIMGGIVGGMCVGIIFFLFAGESDTGYAWIYVGAVIGAVLSVGILDIIFSRALASFFRYKWQMLGVTVFTILLFAIFTTNLTGYDTFIPKKNNIAKATIILSDYHDQRGNHKITDGVMTWDSESHQFDEDYNVVLKDADLIYEILSAGVRTYGIRKNDPDGSTFSGYYYGNYYYSNSEIQVKVTLKSGITYYRNYRLSQDDIELVRKIVETEEYRKKCFAEESLDVFLMPDNIEVRSLRNESRKINDPVLMKKLFDAYRADFKEHYNLEEISSGVYTTLIYCNYKEPDRQGEMDYIDLHIMYNYERCNAVLDEIFGEGRNELKESDKYYLTTLGNELKNVEGSTGDVAKDYADSIVIGDEYFRSNMIPFSYSRIATLSDTYYYGDGLYLPVSVIPSEFETLTEYGDKVLYQ